jgi:hypothetical protein
MTKMQWRKDDGGRASAGFKGSTGDCVTRAIAIATGQPYRAVYDELNERAKAAHARSRKKTKGKRSYARTGLERKVYEPYLLELGWEWVPTMKIGQGCTVHLRADELPSGRLVVAVSKHLCAVIDGVVHDTHDPSRDGTRCVYGYYREPAQ